MSEPHPSPELQATAPVRQSRAAVWLSALALAWLLASLPFLAVDAAERLPDTLSKAHAALTLSVAERLEQEMSQFIARRDVETDNSRALLAVEDRACAPSIHGTSLTSQQQQQQLQQQQQQQQQTLIAHPRARPEADRWIVTPHRN